jgi:hypothetical protein
VSAGWEAAVIIGWVYQALFTLYLAWSIDQRVKK